MARARNIKPGFFLNEELVELSFEVRLFFIGLWTVADREGRLEDKPKRIKMHLFPADEIDVDQCLELLAKSGFITRYVVDGNRFIQILTFAKHQNPHRDEKASTIPAPCEHGANTVQVVDKHDGNRADSLIPDSLPLNPDTSIKPRAKAQDDYPPDFERAWECYPKRPGASKKESFKAWSARLKAGASSLEMMDGVHRYAAYVTAKQTEPDFIKQPATFFGPSEHYKADWTIQPRASPAYQTANEKQKSLADRLTGKNRNEQPPALIDIN